MFTTQYDSITGLWEGYRNGVFDGIFTSEEQALVAMEKRQAERVAQDCRVRRIEGNV